MRVLYGCLLCLLWFALPSVAQTTQVEICGDGIDNDGDGRIDDFDTDCNDIDCFFIPVEKDSLQFSTVLQCEYLASEDGLSWRAYDPPMVADLDGDDYPEIIKLVTLSSPAAFVIINGENCELQQKCVLSDTLTEKSGNGVIGDVDRNGYADIFVPSGNKVERWEYDPDSSKVVRRWISAPMGIFNRPHFDIIDLNQDGVAEIIPNKGNMVNSVTGAIYPDPVPFYRGDSNELFAFTADGELGNDAVEVIAGAEMYIYDFSLLKWQLIRTAGDILNESEFWKTKAAGAIADMDLDGDPDAVVTNRHTGQIMIWDLQSGTVIAGPLDFPNEEKGGRCNIGNYDADPAPEIGLTAENEILVYDDIVGGTAGLPSNVPGLETLLWRAETSDFSGHTQMSLFDFEGDGEVELVYRDQDKLRVFRGRGDGLGNPITLMSTGDNSCISQTGMEYPVIADIDNDGEAELISGCLDVLRIFESDKFPWVSAPPYWNTQAYNRVTINTDLTIPKVIQENYKVYNHFLSQITPGAVGDGLTVKIPAPNITVSMSLAGDFTEGGEIDYALCPIELTFVVTLCNIGDARNSENYYFTLFENNPYDASPVPIDVDERMINGSLKPGECMNDTITFQTGKDSGRFYLLANHKQNGDPLPLAPGTVNFTIPECNYGNNIFGPIRISNCDPSLIPGPDMLPDSLSVEISEILTSSLMFSHPDNEPLVLNTTPLTGTTDGQIMIYDDASFSYDPDTLFLGDDFFDYKVCTDGLPVVCDSARVKIHVYTNNKPPIANTDSLELTHRIFESSVAINDTDENDDDIHTFKLLDDAMKGALTLNTDGTFTYAHADDFDSLDCFTYIMCDDGYPVYSDTAKVYLYSNNLSPIVNNDLDTIKAGEELIMNLLANDTDPDGDSLCLSPNTVWGPFNGNAELLVDGTLIYTADITYFGIDSLQYEVCDHGVPQRCETATVTIEVLPANNPPTALDDEFEIDENETLTGNLVLNDFDEDGHEIVVQEQDGKDSDNGSLTIHADGSFIYTPKQYFYGQDTIQYIICDVASPVMCDTGLFIVNILPVNIPPVPEDDSYISYEDETVIAQVISNDSDPEGDDIELVLTPIVYPNNGTLVINEDGSISYVPDLGFIGTDQFTYQICDNGLPFSLCENATVTIIVEPSLELEIFQGISPNNDGMNDFWKIKGIERFPNNSVSVFNRWGNLVYNAKGYNNNDLVWKGEANKGLFVSGPTGLPDGTYFYNIELGDGSSRKVGYVVLKR